MNTGLIEPETFLERHFQAMETRSEMGEAVVEASRGLRPSFLQDREIPEEVDIDLTAALVKDPSSAMVVRGQNGCESVRAYRYIFPCCHDGFLEELPTIHPLVDAVMIRGLGCRAQCSGFRVQGSGSHCSGSQCSAFRFQGLSVQCSGFKVSRLMVED